MDGVDQKMRNRMLCVIAGVLMISMSPAVALAVGVNAEPLEGRVNYFNRSTGDITVDDSGARVSGVTVVTRGNLTLSQAQLRIGQRVLMELFASDSNFSTPEVKAIRILDEGK